MKYLRKFKLFESSHQFNSGRKDEIVDKEVAIIIDDVFLHLEDDGYDYDYIKDSRSGEDINIYIYKNMPKNYSEGDDCIGDRFLLSDLTTHCNELISHLKYKWSLSKCMIQDSRDNRHGYKVNLEGPIFLEEIEVCGFYLIFKENEKILEGKHQYSGQDLMDNLVDEETAILIDDTFLYLEDEGFNYDYTKYRNNLKNGGDIWERFDIFISKNRNEDGEYYGDFFKLDEIYNHLIEVINRLKEKWTLLDCTSEDGENLLFSCRNDDITFKNLSVQGIYLIFGRKIQSIKESNDDGKELKLEQIKELFYEISDDDRFEVSFGQGTSSGIDFSKSNKVSSYDINWASRIDRYPTLNVFIKPGDTKSKINTDDKTIYNNLKFIESYIKEIGLRVEYIYTSDRSYARYIYYKSVDDVDKTKVDEIFISFRELNL